MKPTKDYHDGEGVWAWSKHRSIGWRSDARMSVMAFRPDRHAQPFASIWHGVLSVSFGFTARPILTKFFLRPFSAWNKEGKL